LEGGGEECSEDDIFQLQMELDDQKKLLTEIVVKNKKDRQSFQKKIKENGSQTDGI